MDATPGILRRIFMNPLALREVRQACRSWKLVVFLSIYLLIQGSIFAIWIYVTNERGIFSNPTSIGARLFVTMSCVLVGVVMLVFPAFSSTAIASEHEKKSFDLLLLTPLAPWEIALGKFFAAALQASVFLIATVPLFAMANLFGGIDPAVFFVTLWVLILLSVLISFIGVYASSLVQRAIPAVLVTYLFSMLFGLLLLVIILSLAAGRAFATAAFPLVGFLTDPTLGEGVFYVAAITVSCAIYCTFLFLSTTNRLKPTSHNKSTNLRIFWTAVMMLVPAQFAGYFIIARLSTYGITYGTLVTGAIYLSLLLGVPALSFAAEPPIASRRVRREMDRAPAAVVRAGGSLFFPGSFRGVLHTSLIAVMGFALYMLAALCCFEALRDRMGDRAQLAADFAAVTEELAAPGAAATPSPVRRGGFLPLPPPPILAAPAQMQEALSAFYNWDFKGTMLMCLALLVTVLVCAQITWRMSLSGLSRGISSVLGALVVVVWLILPFLAEQISSSNAEVDSAKIFQFSPIAAASAGAQWGSERGLAEGVGGLAPHAAERAERLFSRWSTFMAAACGLGVCLLASNLFSHRKVMRAFNAAMQQSQQPVPVQVSQAQLDAAMREVIQPATPMQAAQPELPPPASIKTDPPA